MVGLSELSLASELVLPYRCQGHAVDVADLSSASPGAQVISCFVIAFSFRVVCDSFDAGMPAAEVHKTLLEGSTSVEGSGFSPRQAAVFMTKAVQFYCPGYISLFAR
jgi:Protein of unknown function (DUF732)